MPILPTSLDHQLSNLSTSESKECKSNRETFEVEVLITDNLDIDSSDESSHDSFVHAIPSSKPRFQKTESKIREEQGLMADEPLLKENPHRFVIFPIQDNDVRPFVEMMLRVWSLESNFRSLFSCFSWN